MVAFVGMRSENEGKQSTLPFPDLFMPFPANLNAFQLAAAFVQGVILFYLTGRNSVKIVYF